ncbi:MAG: aspartate-semialdehyde dehydrogenase [Gemmatimonadota bacterium]|nr:MAG: aspartate-semialdehyde dehydrogenase [Gemmatimonadota bacterium]
MSDRIDVGVVGATGMVGSRLVELLRDHPWFRLTEVGASQRSAGRTLAEALPPEETDLPDSILGLVLKDPGETWRSRLILSALPAPVAEHMEVKLAEAGHVVVSNASAHRMRPDVPLVIPEVNASHLELVHNQPWAGALVTNPNCVVAGLAMALAPLHRAFGVQRVMVTTFQAISGAGRPGPESDDVVDNVVPLIPGEEEKVAREPRKILGAPDTEGGAGGDACGGAGGIVPADFPISATCVRVPVSHGHLLSISVGLATKATPEEAAVAISGFESAVADYALPSAPARALVVTETAGRPQPKLDRDAEEGMTVVVGRLRACDVLDLKLLALAHNLSRGAAGAALLNAELCHATGVTTSRGLEAAAQ